ncbi:hypothetical protein [Leptolyngbya iicbica]|uniref:Uncharacterized protein n=2 Tax=Cyanophyceae TaxID=3028117 RepID=A0A4V2E2K9_9CYAN|nr:hypothetical protein [Leptolyngbya sp. LK]RZM78916.1 hypothetical protein DYY88_09035 [Leptolyngbya sp. LK]
MGNTFPPPGICSFAALPDPYRTAFRMGSAQHLPGQFLPAHTDWFLQIVFLPFMLLYASPTLILGPWLITQAVNEPGSYLQFLSKIRAVAQTPLQVALTGLLFLVLAGSIAYSTWQAWDLALSFCRTWKISRLRKNREYGYGLVLLSHALAGRLVNNLDWCHNCLWLPRAAIAHIAWQEMREEGAKHIRRVYRTRICYVSATGEKCWLTLQGNVVRADIYSPTAMSDRDLYDTLHHWWQSSPTEH